MYPNSFVYFYRIYDGLLFADSLIIPSIYIWDSINLVIVI